MKTELKTLAVLAMFSIAMIALASLVPSRANAAEPKNEFLLFLRLNGSPDFIGATEPGADGGTIGRVDAGTGNIVKSQCGDEACICPGTSCTCAVGQATTGEKVIADKIHTMILKPNNGMVTTVAFPGSLLPDGGAGVHCDHWVL